MVTDKTGRKIKVGQIVDVQLMGMFQGKVFKIVEAPISIPGGNQIHPHVAVQLYSTPQIMPNGMTWDVYIIGEPDPKDPLVIENETRDKKASGLIGIDGSKLRQ